MINLKLEKNEVQEIVTALSGFSTSGLVHKVQELVRNAELKVEDEVQNLEVVESKLVSELKQKLNDADEIIKDYEEKLDNAQKYIETLEAELGEIEEKTDAQNSETSTNITDETQTTITTENTEVQ